MSYIWVLFIISAILLIAGIVWGIKSMWDLWPLNLTIVFALCVCTFLVLGIYQSISLKKEAVRQEKEREQIIYQIDNISEDTDKIKLNEWILTYNDWVNDINTSKETFGWFSWYYSFDMTKHSIIELV